MRSGARGRVAGLRWYLVAVAATAVLVPLLWSLDDAVLRTATLLASVTSLALVVRRQLRPPDPEEVYADSLGRAVAARVDLSQARVVAVHDHRVPALVVFTWRAALTTLLDADCRPLVERPGNRLTGNFTWSIPVYDDEVVARLASERHLGRLSVYAVTDLAAYPDCNLAADGFLIEQNDLAFPTWSASLATRREALSWDL